MMLFPRTWLYWVAFIALLWVGLPASVAEIPFNQAFTETVPVTSWTEIRDEGIIKQRFAYSCGPVPLTLALSRLGEREICDCRCSPHDYRNQSFFRVARHQCKRKKGSLQFIDPTRDWNR